MDLKPILNQNKLNRDNKNYNTTKKQMRLVTALIIGCILLAYIFLFIDNNVDSDASTLTKVAAVVYFIAIMTIGFSLRAFNKKSLILLFVACVYMGINYLRFRAGLKSDIITLCVIALFILMHKISLSRKYINYILLSLIIPFIVIVAIGRSNAEGYIVNSLFNNMYINSNTISHITFVNVFVFILLIDKKKFSFVHLLVFAIGFVLIYHYASRTALMCLAVLFIGFLFVSSRIKTGTYFKIFILFLICSFVAIIIYAYWLPKIVSEDFVILGKKIFTGRQWIYSGVIDDIMSSPVTFLFGYGHTSFEASNGILLNAHNYWLQLGLTYGMVFLIPMLIIFIKMVNQVIKNYDKTSAKLFITYGICLVLFCMLEAPFNGRTMFIISLIPLIVVKNFACRKNTQKVRAQQPKQKKYIAGNTVNSI